MALVTDKSGILAAVGSNDPAHSQVRQAIAAEPGRLIVPDLALAEVDYMLLKHFGRAAESALLDDVVSGAYSREILADVDLARAQELILKYREHDIGLVDASIVATAERLGVDRILTLDLRHFRLFRYRDRRPFRLLPADMLSSA